jgi:peptide/nickel transport system permease protein
MSPLGNPARSTLGPDTLEVLQDQPTPGKSWRRLQATKAPARWLGVRLLRAMITLLISSFLIFAALYVAPGSPIGFLTGGRTLSPAQIHALEAQYHLNNPFFVRYWEWLTSALHGDFGKSVVYHTSVSSLIGPRAGNTVFLVVYASILIILIGVGLGVLAAVRGRFVDGTISGLTTLGVSIPSFVLAVILVQIFAVDLGLFPVFGSGTGFSDKLWHLTLPAIALAVSGLAYVSQTTRAAVRLEQHREYADTARSRGIPERTVIRRHVFRNALIPITTVCGLTVAALVAGVAVVEVAFGLNGLGAELISAVSDKDFAVVQAISLILVTAFVVVNMVVDVLYVLIDPRTRSGARR